VPFSGDAGVAAVIVQNERYAVLTLPIQPGDDIVGYLQVAEFPQEFRPVNFKETKQNLTNQKFLKRSYKRRLPDTLECSLPKKVFLSFSK
jgi:hypothetical protein